jgi:hypothetical protein
MPPRQRGGASAAIDQILGQDDPLDETEQRQLIAEFESLQLSQHRTFRTLFGTGAAAGGAFFLLAAHAQAVRPWETRYTGELRTVVSRRGAAAALLLQAAALLAAAAGLLLRLPRRGDRARGCAPAGAAAWGALGAAAAAAGGGAAYWGSALYRSRVKYGAERGAHPELLWLPLAPLAYVILCCYVLRSMAASGREVEQLKKMTYDFKKV